MNFRPLNIFFGCECSGVGRRAFRELGHSAWSCDYKAATDGERRFHVQGDALSMLHRGRPTDGAKWDLAIVHPPCTRLANSGVLRLYVGGKKSNGPDVRKWAEMKEGAKFFRSFFIGYKGRIVGENPIMHGWARAEIGLSHVLRQTVQPHQFGDDASKATVLWLVGVPPLVIDPAKAFPPRMVNGKPRWGNQTDSGQNKLPPSEGRAAARAVTYPGIARAMAEQWSTYLLTNHIPRP